MYRTLRLRCLSRPQAIQLTPLPYVLPVFSRNVQTSSDPQTPNPPKARPPPLIDIVGPPSAHVNVKLRYQKEYGQYEPLPALPKAPPYPCPLLTQDELDTYLVPLYSRKWGITTLEKRNEDASRFHVRQLAAMFNFESDVDVKEFVTSISEIIKFENHHPAFSHDESAVYFTVHTHSAMRPQQQADGTTRNIRTSGITLRDIRMAYRVESVFNEFVGSQRAFRRIHPLTTSRPRKINALKTIRARPPNYQSRQPPPCPICSGKQGFHYPFDCPVRYISQPKWPCKICGGRHWKVNCPKAFDSPPHPCPLCGSPDHWKAHCPTEAGRRFTRSIPIPENSESLTADLIQMKSRYAADPK